MEKPIESIEQLEHLAYQRDFECKLRLNGGVFSRKTISFDPVCDCGCPLWTIYNHIDDTSESYDETEAFKKGYPLLFEAIKVKALTYENKI